MAQPFVVFVKPWSVHGFAVEAESQNEAIMITLNYLRSIGFVTANEVTVHAITRNLPDKKKVRR
jgi:hypothetical protein